MENTISKARIYLTLFALGCAGGSIYIIPYIRSVFYDLQLQVTGMTNTQSAFLMSVYAAFGMIIGVPVGMIVDRLNLKDGIRWALIGTTIVTIVYSVYIYIICGLNAYMVRDMRIYFNLLAGILKDFEYCRTKDG